jgi:hypothetical protein
MKKILISALLVIVLVGITFFYLKRQTKSHSPEEVATYTEGAFKFEVRYSRPFKKGRDIFGSLEPYGKVWRTGANEATEFEINQPILFNGVQLAAGKYALFTVPSPSEWTVIVNSKLGQWGAFTYDASEDVLRTKVPVLSLTDTVQQMKIDFTSTPALRIAWDLTAVEVPFKVQ